MDSTLIAAGIAAVTAIIAAIISPMVSVWLKNRKYLSLIPSPPLVRKKSLYGTWKGELIQKVGCVQLCKTHEITLTFEANTNPIVGSFKLVFNKDSKVETDDDMQVFNTIYDGRILKFDYSNKDGTTIHFGSMYAELSASGSNITGHFLGFGRISEMFVNGDINLNKMTEK